MIFLKIFLGYICEDCVYVNPHFVDMKLTATEEEDLRRRWQCAMGPRYQVTVRVSRVKLGIKNKIYSVLF